MNRFKFFTEEGDQMAVAGLNVDFIRRAEKVISFNLTAVDFQSVEYKREIQWLFTKNFFPSFDINRNAIDTVDKSRLNTAINKLKTINKSGYEKLHKYNIKGIGPGEIVMYYLLNKGYLGGGGSAGVDLIVGSNKYEIKAVDITSDGYATNFKLGSTFSTADIIRDLQNLKKQTGGSGSEVNKSELELIRKNFPDDLARIEKDYIDRSYNKYFKNHDIIFIRNSTGKIGDIEAVKKVEKKDIFLERVTSGVIKPKVKI